ncbi:uncharacterized protein UV8b_07002 [Ustilaginoidea virens]|uniref:histone acetyltransferase n=1 Tax=Ustilaginoidea virens TaxID=1159556 RepID=A0A063CB52_USTVR|nr:uncharacterized protein UV8b_07002 [Ustilaginoidea virens]QUC22761.1 hypothetical protein UV8b_07002 [Ustilaginoidea virens]GAO16511.1 hypothetical protein UVI_02010820 [Ustilaginoidea virens]
MAPVPPNPSASQDPLAKRLSAALPKDVPFGVYHVSTPPRKTDALCSAPPNQRPDRTFCENHFLAVTATVAPEAGSSSQDADPAATEARAHARTKVEEVVVLGLEIFIYTTAHSTTLFVSKADSTGYLRRPSLPRGSHSPIRHVCATFIEFLVESRRRRDVPLVISLFARSQGQYLFPGSVKHGGKHVLDDGGLIKWWCRVLQPLIESASGSRADAPGKAARGYLVVPGLDARETRAFIPRSATAPASWSLSHPLDKISHYSREFDWVPPRCLIPRFPDDPKSRFRDELDDEAGRSGAMKRTGSWGNVDSLQTFWDMMAYRQECSSGRMTGFIWVVFDDEPGHDEQPGGQDQAAAPGAAAPRKQTTNGSLPVNPPKSTPRKLFPSRTDRGGDKTGPGGKSNKSRRKRIKLRGPIKPRQPRVKTEQQSHLLRIPARSAYYYWPTRGRGERIVDEMTYKRATELMLHSDFSTLDKAAGSSARWIKEVGMGNDWGYTVVGEGQGTIPGDADTSGAVNNLTGLVKRKRADTAGGGEEGVNVLGGSLVKRKPKDEPKDGPQRELAENGAAVRVLSSGLVRKKPKA